MWAQLLEEIHKNKHVFSTTLRPSECLCQCKACRSNPRSACLGSTQPPTAQPTEDPGLRQTARLQSNCYMQLVQRMAVEAKRGWTQLINVHRGLYSVSVLVGTARNVGRLQSESQSMLRRLGTTLNCRSNCSTQRHSTWRTARVQAAPKALE